MTANWTAAPGQVSRAIIAGIRGVVWASKPAACSVVRPPIACRIVIEARQLERARRAQGRDSRGDGGWPRGGGQRVVEVLATLVDEGKVAEVHSFTARIADLTGDGVT